MTQGLLPLMVVAASRRLTREQLLRRALRDGTAVQREGRWYVATSVPSSKPTARTTGGVIAQAIGHAHVLTHDQAESSTA